MRSTKIRASKFWACRAINLRVKNPAPTKTSPIFATKTFGVTFDLTAKADVRGKNQHPLYAELTKFKNGILPGLIKWNFEKFLVNNDGEIVARFAPTVEPDSAEVVAAIEKQLA